MEILVGVLTGFVVRVSALLYRWKQLRKRARPYPTCLTPFMGEDQEMDDLLRRAKTREHTSAKSPKKK